MAVIRDKIKVSIRIRPPKNFLQELSTKVVFNDIFVKEKLFSFDNVFDIYTRQETIFESSVKPLIDSFLMGINSTVLAYGQTGSGKTYTMGTHTSDGGIIPQVLEYIFGLDIMMRGDAGCSIQFLELYNEEVRDLLLQRGQSSSIRLIDGKNGVTVSGLSARNVRTVNEAMASLREGGKSRMTAATAMNAESSRSHAIFTVVLTQNRINEEGEYETSNSKFNFVDLAGSERLQRTKAVGTRAKEGININYGLLALGNVINALSEMDASSKTTRRHIPYRDSKLTRLLEDSLGGTSKCLMIACVCPSPDNVSETLNTLNYAARVKNIENKISVNTRTTIGGKEDNNAANCHQLQQRILDLELQLSKANEQAKETKFVTEATNLIKLQGQLNELTNEDTMTSVDSLCYLMSLENDSNLIQTIPSEWAEINRTLAYERTAVEQKIKAAKELSRGQLLNNNLPTTLIDHFVSKLDESTTINGLKLNSVAINNCAAQKNMSQTSCHELRWKYLLNFISQRYIITNCLYKDIIKQYERQLTKSYKLIESTLSHLNPDAGFIEDMVTEIKSQHHTIRTSIGQRQTPVLAFKNLESRLNYLFPLGHHQQLNATNVAVTNQSTTIPTSAIVVPTCQDENTHHNVITHRAHEPMEVDSDNRFYTQTRTFNRTISALKRKTSMKLADQQINILNEKQGFVRRNGLCLPIIKSPEKNSATKVETKKTRVILEDVNKRPMLTSITNNTKHFEDLRKFLFKKKEIDIMANFKLRNQKRLGR